MKILHIAYFGKSGKLNGVAEAVTNLANAQKRFGHEVKIAITTNHSIVDDSFIYYLPTDKELLDLLKSYTPSIVVFHSLYEFQQITFSYIFRKYNIPYLLVFHGGASIDNAKKGWLKKKIANVIFFNWFIYKAKAVIYLNQNEYEKSIFKRINKKYFIIPNGVNIPQNIPTNNNNRKINITYLSRIDYYGKGLDVLLLAIKKLKSEGWADKIVFSFYGHSYDNMYKKLFGFGDFLEYKGFVTGPQKAQAFIESSIIILPSRSEGMPMVILEALSFGRPCIVTPMTNMSEIIRDNECGWVIDLTVDSIIETIKNAYHNLIDNPDFYYCNCRKVAQDYSWDKVAKESVDVYQSLI